MIEVFKIYCTEEFVMSIYILEYIIILYYTILSYLIPLITPRFLGQFRRLGATIIYASFTRVIIDTKKNDINAAIEYTSFIISALRSNSVFEYVQIAPKGMCI